MLILAAQALCLIVIVIALLCWAVSFPHPSLLLRRWLPPARRWPEAQIRGWLGTGRFQPAFLQFFYRDPNRIAPPGVDLVAPADGLITSADIRDGVRYLVIALSFWDMHVQRSPLAGTVTDVERQGADYMDGEGRQFAFLREKPCPVQARIVFRTGSGTLAVRLITSIAARRIETWTHVGDAVQRGQRIGRILLGSTVVLELPPSLALAVNVGERVRAGETIVARSGAGA